MEVMVTLEHSFLRTPDGAVWTQGAFAYPFWARYLEVFDGVHVVARVRDVPAVAPDWQRADGPSTSYTAVPYYLGPLQYLRRVRQIGRCVREAFAPGMAVIMRVGSTIAASLEPVLHRSRHPYGVEVVGDPYDVFAPGAVRHALRPYFRWWSPRQLRRQCAHACAAAYVTEHALQRRYPCPGYRVGVSDVDLPPHAFVERPRPAALGQSWNLITVGSLEQLYKGPYVLLDALALAVEHGIDLRAVWVGDGRYRAELERFARQEGLADRVTFAGQAAAGEAVRAYLDDADLFVLPSLTEGLPRAMLEAMARALPCVGTAVGGIPELLAPEDTVQPGDAEALFRKLEQVVTAPRRMARMSERSLDKARRYRDAVVRERRLDFYRHVREKTEHWVSERP